MRGLCHLRRQAWGSWAEIAHSRRGGGPMSKIRSVRQHAPPQDEGPGTGAALLAGAVLGLATDAVALARPRQQARLLSAATLAAAGRGIPPICGGRRPPVCLARADRRAARVHGAGRPSRPARLAGLLGAGWLAHVTWDALHHRGRGPTRYGPGTRRSASATTWPSLRRCSPASSSWGPAQPALRRPASRSRPGRPGPDSSPEDRPQNRPCQHRTDSEVAAGWSVNPPAGRRLGHAHRR